DIYDARRRLQDRLQATPLRQSSWLSDTAQARVFLKLEAINLTVSFKIRGAFNAVLSLLELRAAGEPPLVVAASAGTHGRAIACTCEQLGLRAAVFTPRDA